MGNLMEVRKNRGIYIWWNFTNQIMTSKTPIRSMEDIDERALDYAEIQVYNERIKAEEKIIYEQSWIFF